MLSSVKTLEKLQDIDDTNNSKPLSKSEKAAIAAFKVYWGFKDKRYACKICGYRVLGGEQRSLQVNAGCCYVCARKLKREWGIDQMRPRKDTAASNAGNLRKRY